MRQTTGFLAPAPVALTPDLRFNEGSLVGQFINDHETAILAERFEVPATFGGGSFLGGAVFNDLIAWRAPNVRNNEARHKGIGRVH